ncbi:hypothetical protein DH2020_013173 [Rehmannia glutinosa]|uniref:RING-type domain-containing protein n=1 Tax=Rehmannia glutinosa TaxID=99300 RepID=A0ABR0X290_REHGL
MEDSSDRSGNLGNTGVIELTGKIMVVAIILLFFVVVFVFCLHLYAKWFWYRRQEPTTTTTPRRRRRRFDFAAGHQEITVVGGHGLDPVSEGEKARLLPKCNHGFHLECIDMWLQSHSTCPLCRNPVSNQKTSNSVDELAPMGENSSVNAYSIEAPSFPTNVLFWGDENRVSTFGPCSEDDHRGSSIAEPSTSSSSSMMVSNSSRPDGILVIDIPGEIDEDEEQKSPMPTRLRSLKRLLSGNRKVSPSSPRNLDTEQVFVEPKTPMRGPDAALGLAMASPLIVDFLFLYLQIHFLDVLENCSSLPGIQYKQYEDDTYNQFID